MLDEDKHAALQSHTDQFLGKALTSIAANTYCDSPAGVDTKLLPTIMRPVKRPDGEDPFLPDYVSNLPPVGGNCHQPQPCSFIYPTCRMEYIGVLQIQSSQCMVDDE